MESQNEQEGIVNPTNQADPNPAKIFIEWKSKPKCFVYWNKEKKENVEIPLPFTFIPLYRCESLKGYNHKKKKTYISNEVTKLNDIPVVVKSYNNATKEKKVEHSGLYPDFKTDMDEKIKFTVSMYAALKNKKGELALVNLQLNGAAIHHWFDFENSNKIWGNAIEVNSTTEEENGDVTYNAPVFKTKPITKEENISCGKLQKEISEYLAAYFAKNGNISQNNTKPSVSSERKEAPKPDSNPVITSMDYDDDPDLPF